MCNVFLSVELGKAAQKARRKKKRKGRKDEKDEAEPVFFHGQHGSFEI